MYNSHIETTYALVGAYDYDVREIVWVYVDTAHAETMVEHCIWQYRGYRMINNQYTRLYYLPPPTV